MDVKILIDDRKQNSPKCVVFPSLEKKFDFEGLGIDNVLVVELL